MIYIIAIQATTNEGGAACLWKIGQLWFSREEAEVVSIETVEHGN